MNKIMLMIGKGKIWRSRAFLACVCVTGALLVSCRTKDPENIPEPTSDIVMSFVGMTQGAVENMQVYLFNGTEGADRGKFRYKILQINTVSENTLSMSAPAGTWDMALVSTESGSGMGSLMQPTVGRLGSGETMFVLKPVGGVLYSAPELLTARIAGQTVAANAHTTASASFSRNVALVRLTIKEPRGLKAGGSHKVSIGNIPTTIAWDGGLLPDRHNPAVSSERMEGTFTITDVAGGGGAQNCSTVSFLVPADRNGTTTNRLNVKVDVALASGGNYASDQPVEIDIAPQANRILEVNLQIGGTLDVSANILPWENVPLDESELANPYTEMMVSTTHSKFVLSDKVVVTTNGACPDLARNGDSAASWLTAAWSGGSTSGGTNTVALSGDPETYDGVERNSWITLTLNGFTKRIKVSQKDAGPGTIAVEPDPVILSPVHKTREVIMKPNQRGDAGPFKISTGASFWPLKNVESVSPAETSTVALNGKYTLRRKEHTSEADKFDVYVENILRIHNTKSLEMVKIPVRNVFMQSDDIYVNPPKHRQDTVTYSNVIEMFGGDKRFGIGAKSDWILEAQCVDNPDPSKYGEAPYILQLKTQRHPLDEEREGTIEICNLDDPDYKMQVKVRQEFYTDIEPFDYFVAKFTWQTHGSRDVDIVAEFVNNGAIFDSPWNGDGSTPLRSERKSVGYRQWNYITINGEQKNGTNHLNADNLLVWGGDATTGQGETVFFRAPLITPESPRNDMMPTVNRNVKLDLYVIWWSGNEPNEPMRVAFNTYEGGKMLLITGEDMNDSSEPVRIMNKNFYNVPNGVTKEQLLARGGYRLLNKPKFHQDRVFPVTKAGANQYDAYRSEYLHVATLHYDRYKRSARVEWHVNDYTGSIIVPTRTTSGTQAPAKNDYQKKSKK